MNNLCIIPARGGSKRIPRKNIRDFNGKPIISYAIETALRSSLFSEVMVSTEDEEIKSIAMEFGAKVPFLRSNEKANDYASTFDVLAEVLDVYKSFGQSFDNVCCIYPCTPLNSVNNLASAFQLLIEKEFDTVFTISKYNTPIYRAFKISNDHVYPIFPEYELTRSQDLNAAYYDAGQFYWMNVERLLRSKKILSENVGFIELDEMQVQDIDNESDWQFAQMKYELLNRK